MLGKIFDIFAILCLIVVLGFIGAYCLHMISITFPGLVRPVAVVFIFVFGYILLNLLEN